MIQVIDNKNRRVYSTAEIHKLAMEYIKAYSAEMRIRELKEEAARAAAK